MQAWQREETTKSNKSLSKKLESRKYNLRWIILDFLYLAVENDA